MAEILEDSQMLLPAFELKRENRWVLEWDGIDSYLVRQFARPQANMGEVTLDFINGKRYFQGKFEWSTSQFVLTDPITPSQAQKVMEWVRLGFENITGRAGYKEFYTAKNFKLKLLDPVGAVVEQWDYINAFLSSVDFGSLDYTSAEPTKVTCTIRFDMAIHQF